MAAENADFDEILINLSVFPYKSSRSYGKIRSPTIKLNGSFRYHTFYILEIVIIIIIVDIPDISDDVISGIRLAIFQ